MAVIRIKSFIENSDFAGSRQSGEKIREEIARLVEAKNDGVTLDFAQIKMITQSFGDEVLGILTRVHGIDYIKKNIRLVNESDEIKSILNYVIRYSKKYHSDEVA